MKPLWVRLRGSFEIAPPWLRGNPIAVLPIKKTKPHRKVNQQ